MGLLICSITEGGRTRMGLEKYVVGTFFDIARGANLYSDRPPPVRWQSGIALRVTAGYCKEVIRSDAFIPPSAMTFRLG
jgi:hypothetical protein